MARNILECKDCGARYDVSRREPGSKVNCKRCRAVLKVPKKAKIKASKKLPKEAATSKRAKKEVSKRLPSDEGADPHDLRAGEMVQEVQVPYRENPVQAKAMIISFATMLRQTLGRLVAGSLTVLILGTILSILFILVIGGSADVSDPDSKARAVQTLTGIIYLIGVVGILMLQCMGMLLGAKVLRDEDDYRDESASAWKWSLGSSLKALKESAKVFWKMLILDAVFYTGMVAAAVFVLGVTKLPDLLSVPLSILNFFLLIAVTIVLYLIVSIAMVGVIVERRPIIFSIKRAAVLIKSALLPILGASVMFALISSAFSYAFALLGTFLFGPGVGTAFASALSKAFFGLFITAVHFELTKDEGKG